MPEAISSASASLYEALYGHLPFAEQSIAEISANALAGKLSPPPPGTAVPREIHLALTRGLSIEPSQRFPSMAALLSALALQHGHAAAALHLTRRRAVNLFVVFIVLSNFVLFRPGANINLSLIASAKSNAVMLAVFFGIGLMLRKTLLGNAFHRRIYTWCAVSLTQRFVLMLFAICFALPFRQYLCFDLVVLAGAFTLVTFLGLPTLFWVLPLLLLVSAIGAHYGDTTIPYLLWFAPCTAAAMALAWSSASDRAQREVLLTAAPS